tara:strand:+ start:1285 stop:1620 length:336 start_codon:yes stop_codon:yes gene_type:complete
MLRKVASLTFFLKESKKIKNFRIGIHSKKQKDYLFRKEEGSIIQDRNNVEAIKLNKLENYNKNVLTFKIINCEKRKNTNIKFLNKLLDFSNNSVFILMSSMNIWHSLSKHI